MKVFGFLYFSISLHLVGGNVYNGMFLRVFMNKVTNLERLEQWNTYVLPDEESAQYLGSARIHDEERAIFWCPGEDENVIRIYHMPKIGINVDENCRIECDSIGFKALYANSLGDLTDKLISIKSILKAEKW